MTNIKMQKPPFFKDKEKKKKKKKKLFSFFTCLRNPRDVSK